jgi:hypothetical protein
MNRLRGYVVYRPEKYRVSLNGALSKKIMRCLLRVEELRGWLEKIEPAGCRGLDRSSKCLYGNERYAIRTRDPQLRRLVLYPAELISRQWPRLVRAVRGCQAEGLGVLDRPEGA